MYLWQTTMYWIMRRALLDMLDLLDKNQIKHSGAGRNLEEAM